MSIKKRIAIPLITLLSFSVISTAMPPIVAQTTTDNPTNVPDWYLRAQKTKGVPWTVLIALDAYGASTSPPLGVKRTAKEPFTKSGFRFSPWLWQGLGNPVQNDTEAARILFFKGYGKDGDGDGKATQDDPYDRVTAIASWLSQSGTNEFDPSEVLWDYFQHESAVDRIMALANVYRKFNSGKLTDRVFPLSKKFSVAFNDTWGQGRSFGGRRMHEGTDIFAGYGTPVLSVCYGYVELIGWNRLGGWRIGIRSADNYYYYYAHMSSYTKGIKQGTIVQPGQVIGYVGSSGYGKPGTSGKFPPHLHFGVYRDTGSREWAFDPYPLLKRWERNPQIIIYPKRPVR